jgi:tetratricopeptide (TPR) repeat protein
MILRADPKQITAKNMIDDARQKMAGSSTNLKNDFHTLIDKGHYEDALVKLESLLASDPTSPLYEKLRDRLRRISALVSRKGNSKAWNTAAAGISTWVSDKEDLSFSYDALRYAAELAPADRTIPRLVAALEEEDAQLKLNDTKPANAAILDHKKEMALRQIYDSKFYLAAKELEEVLRLEPQDIVALKRLGSVYLQLKDYKQARRTWQKAAELSPEDEQLKEYLAALDQVSPAPQPGAKPERKTRRRAKI